MSYQTIDYWIKRQENLSKSDLSALRLLLTEPGCNYGSDGTISPFDFNYLLVYYQRARWYANRHKTLLTREMCEAKYPLSAKEKEEMESIPAKLAYELAIIHPAIAVHDDGDIRANTIYLTLPSGRGNTFPAGWITMD